jgi:hypothetical protein
MRGDVVDHAADPRQDAPRARVAGIESPEEVGQLRQGDSGVVHDSKLKKLIDFVRRLALEQVQIDARVEQPFWTWAGSRDPV